MKEEDVDKIIKNQINNNIQAPESLKARIRKEIKNMDNDVEKNKSKKISLKVMQSIVAMAVVSILGITTYATVTKNPILERLGLIKGSTTYEEVAKEINKDLSNDYAQITLKRMASDNAYVIMEYYVNLKEKGIEKFGDIEKDTFSGYDIDIANSIKINDEEIDIAFNRIQYAKRISETEYEIFQIIQVANIESKDLKIEISQKYLIANEQQTEINKLVVIDATKKENTKEFKKIEKKVENKTITVESFQNTAFETFIKVSVDITNITKNDLDSVYSEKNPNNLLFTILDNNNNYIPHFCYMKKSVIEDDKGNKMDILDNYDENNNISYENAKSHLEYIVTLGDIDKEISELKIIPYICILPDERGEDYDDYYNNLEWHKLESGEYKQKNTLGGELELTKMEVNSKKIKFAYDLRGFITGREETVLLRIKDERLGFNVIEPTNTYIKKIDGEEYVAEFYRDIENTGIYSYNFENEEDYKLKDISKIEFALLAEPTIKLLDSEIELKVPEANESYLTINEVKVKELESSEISNISGSNIFNDIVDIQDNNKNNTVNNIINDVTIPDNLPSNSKKEVFGENDNKIGNIVLGMTENEVKSVLGAPLGKYDSNDGFVEHSNIFVYEYDGLEIGFKEENGKNVVYYIGTNRTEDEGPRGVKIGDIKDKVIGKFYANDNMSVRDETTKELYKINGDKYIGLIVEYDTGTNIQYSGDKLEFHICLDKNGVVTRMTLEESLY